MAKNKNVDLDDLFENEEEYPVVDETGEKVEDLPATDKSFCTVWNHTEKRFDLLTIHINGPSGRVVKIEREATRYDTRIRAMHHIIQLVTNQFIKK